MKIKKFFKKKEINKIISFMKKDKKNLNEKINLILIKKIGKTTQPNSFAVNSSEIKKFLTCTTYLKKIILFQFLKRESYFSFHHLK